MSRPIVPGPGGASPTDDFAPPTPEERRVTDKLYDGNAAETPVPRDADGFYGFSTLTAAIGRRWSELAAVTGAPEADHARVRNVFLGIARTTNLPEPLLATIADHYIDTKIAETRPVDDAEAEDAAQAQRTQAWNEESRVMLKNTYGKDAEDLLRRTNTFIRRHPALQQILQERGLGSRPEIVADVCAFVFSQGIR